MTVHAALANWNRLLSAVAGVLLVADALFLMQEGLFSLGVTLPFFAGASLIFLAINWHEIQRLLESSRKLRRLWRAGWIAAFAWLCSLGLFFGFLARSQAGAAEAYPRAIVVLGGGVPGGKVSPTLALRLDLALQQAARHPGIPVLVSGGLGYGETLSEGRVMGDYLRARGLDAARIVQEEEADSTEENLLFSMPLLQQRGVSAHDPILLITSDFHTIRAQRIAARAGYSRISALGSSTPLYIRYNAWLREYFAFISGFVLREY